MSLSVLATASPFYAFQQSDAAGRLIVVILFCASILAWAIIVEKWLYLRRTQRQLQRFLEAFRKDETARVLFLELDSRDGPLREIADIGRQTLAAVCDLSETDLLAHLRANRALRLTPSAIDRIRTAMEGAVDAQVGRLEVRLGFLGSIVSASPFLGLLGTVWGVMMAFTGMAAAGKADINAIAPGVSGALLTTVVGLLVAIPALIGFNMLASMVKQMIISLDHFADEVLSLLKLHYQGTEPS